MSTKDEPLNLIQEGSSLCTPFRLKTNTSSVYLNLISTTSGPPVEVKIIGQTNGEFVNYTYETTCFLLTPGKKYFLYNNSPANTNVRLEFTGNSMINGVWSPDSSPESGCITIGPEYKQKPNTHDENFDFSSTTNNTVFETNSRDKNTKSSIYINLTKSSFPGTIDVSVIGVGDDEQANCTNRAESFQLSAGKKYELYNTVKENGFKQAKIRFKLSPNISLKGSWSPDYSPEKGVIAVRGGCFSSSGKGNTSDTNFNFNLNSKSPQNTESREKQNSSSVYICIDSMSGPFKVRVFGVGGVNGTKNETNKADFYVISNPGKYQLYNNVHENEHDSAFLQFESDQSVQIQGKWSPDFSPDPSATVLTGQNVQQATLMKPVSGAIKLIKVPYLSQQGIPTGCESVSAVMTLQWSGIDITAYEFITQHLIMRPVWQNPDPNCCFVGNPYSRASYGCFSPCICRAIGSVLESRKKNNNLQVQNLTGAPFYQLISQFIDKNVPVILWATMGMRPTKFGSSKWTIKFVNGDAKYKPGDQFSWPGNEHCLVLVGYTQNEYIFNDPLSGIGMYPKDVVEARYKEQGNQAVVLIQNSSQKVEYPKQFKMPVIYPQPMKLFPGSDSNSNDKKLSQQEQWAKGINGALKVVVGTASAAAAASVAVGTGGVGAVVGGAAIGFAASNVTEGVIDIYNAVQGNDTKSINPIRDFLFMGNKDFYDATDLALNLGAATLGMMSKALNLPLNEFSLMKCQEDKAVLDAAALAKRSPNATSTTATGWCMDPNGSIINGRYYSGHALERMAPKTIQVEEELARRYLAKKPGVGLVQGTAEYAAWKDGFYKYICPRNIPPIVIEDAIANGARSQGHTPLEIVCKTDYVKVIINTFGDVITVFRK